MTRKVFLDSNGWIALLNSGDFLHAKASTRWKEFGRQGYQVVLTDLVIAETGNGLARGGEKLRFATSLQRFFESSECEVVFTTRPLLHQGLQLYTSRSDKDWGLVDCVSFVVMRELEITAAFTSDQHFEQAGFNCSLAN